MQEENELRYNWHLTPRGFQDDDSIDKNPFLNGRKDTPSNHFEIEGKVPAP